MYGDRNVTEKLIEFLVPMIEIARIWGPLLIFVFMAVESSFVPFPSEVVMIPAGFMAARGELLGLAPMPAATLAILCGVLGSLAGAYVNYYLSLKLGRPFLHRYGKYFLLKPEALDRAEEIFREYGNGATFVCRMLPAIRQLISIPAGLSRMNFAAFSLYTALGAGLWVIVLTVMGYWFGVHSREMGYPELIHHCKDLLHHYKIWIVLGGAAILAAYVWVHHKVMKGGAKKQEA